MSCNRVKLMGTHEIKVRLGSISRQRVNQLTAKAHFPKPVADLEQGRVWLADDIEKWISTHRAAADPAS
ncbi:helix-turn-helix transcriptional regulator [Actinoplanes teichomyceticus]|nr:DNA-binding protein [Actinoplanes teichomyceticus]